MEQQQMEQQTTEAAKKQQTKKETSKKEPSKKKESSKDGGDVSSSQSVTKTVTKTTKTSQQEGDYWLRRGPFTAMKSIVVTRSSGDSVDYGGSSQRFASRSSYTSASSSSLQHSVEEMSSMLTGRQKEKQQLQELNERFASYIEKVRFLEAQNRKQAEELQRLRESWGKETEKVKQLYEVELQQLRRLLEEADRYKGEAEVRISSLEDQLNEVQQLLEAANKQHQADREAVDKLSTQMAEYDAEISLLRRRAAAFDEEKARDQAEIKRLRQDVTRMRTDLDNETLQHINAENRAQSLQEELEFLRALHESELKELAALAYRDTTQENREFWKNEMAQAMHDIQREFDSKLETVRSEVESQYSIRVQEAKTSNTRDNMELAHLKEENKRIKAQITDSRGRIPELEARNAQLERELEELRREMEEAQRDCEMQKNQLRTDLASCNATLEEYLRELQTLMDAKLSMELEIIAYRKLLEGEETRIEQSSSSSKQISSSSTSITRQQTSSSQQQQSGSSSSSMMQQQQKSGSSSSSSTMQQQGGGMSQTTVTEESRTMSAKISYERTAKGNVKIEECAEDATYIVLENTGKRTENIGGWKLTRVIDDDRMVGCPLPPGTELNTSDRRTLKIWTSGMKPDDDNGIEADIDDWGVGNNIVTKLINADGEERASHTQRTTYSAE